MDSILMLGTRFFMGMGVVYFHLSQITGSALLTITGFALFTLALAIFTLAVAETQIKQRRCK